MVFSSPLFLFYFMPVFFLIYLLTPKIEWKNLIAILFSLIFYSWGEPIFVFFVVGGTFIDYVIIRRFICSVDVSEKTKRIAVFSAITLNVCSLAYFKYANFFLDQINPLWQLLFGHHLGAIDVVLPLGISFIAFHKISLVVDIYKQRTKPPKAFYDILLYILVFPQLVAGPIIRYHDISDQLRGRVYSSDDFLIGFLRFTVGLTKKVLIADPVGQVADFVFSSQLNTLPVGYLWLGALAYTLQIYFDFSAYSDMAIGLARMMSFRFPENFNRPYLAHSVTDFWQRWHISLSNWMRLYLYIPLGGNRVAKWRMMTNLWIVFLLSGLWHGAAWTFIVWGGYYGFFLSIEKAFENRRMSNMFPRIARWTLTMFIVVTGWVIFRASDIGNASDYICRMYLMCSVDVVGYPEPFYLIIDPAQQMAFFVGLILSLSPLPDRLTWASVDVRSALNIALIFAFSVGLFSVASATVLAGDYSPFLYFRF